MAQLFNTYPAWLKTNFPVFWERRARVIPTIPDLRPFQSPEAMASLSRWDPWKELQYEFDTLIGRAECSRDMMLFETLAGLDGNAERKLGSLFSNQELEIWSHTYPVISYAIFVRPELHFLAVRSSHPNLDYLLATLTEDELFSLRYYATTPNALQLVWRTELKTISSHYDTILNCGLYDERLVEHLWRLAKEQKNYRNLDELLRMAVITDASSVIIEILESHGDKINTECILGHHRVDALAFSAIKTIRSFPQIKEKLRIDQKTLKDRIISFLSETVDLFTVEILTIMLKMFPHLQSCREALMSKAIETGYSQILKVIIDAYGLQGLSDNYNPLLISLSSGKFGCVDLLVPHYTMSSQQRLVHVVSEDSYNIIECYLERYGLTEDEFLPALNVALNNSSQYVSKTIFDFYMKRYSKEAAVAIDMAFDLRPSNDSNQLVQEKTSPIDNPL